MQHRSYWLVLVGGFFLPCRSAGAQEITTTVSSPTPAPASGVTLAPTAGAGDAAATEPPPAAVREELGPPGTIKIRFRANQPGVVFHYSALARPNPDFVPMAWSRLCLGECEVFLKPGPYRFALSSGADEPVMAPRLVDLRTAKQFEGTYSDRSSRRQTGALILGLGGAASAANMALGVALANNTDRDLGTATLIGGTVGLLLSLVIGLPLAFSSDDATLEPAQ